jgi:SMODS-associating 2TM, beta-strand rich effector domain
LSNLSLTTSELERLLKVFLGMFLLVWTTSFIVQHHAFDIPLFPAAWRAFGFFYKFAWRWEWLAKLMSRPVVHGLWAGELKSDFSKKNGETIAIPIVFVVRQTYLTISVQSFTNGQEGESRLEALLKSSKTDATRLCYVFELRKLYPGAHALVSGAGELKLIADEQELHGTYWTNTPTHGEIRLKLVSRDCDGINSYQDAAVRLKRLNGASGKFALQ